MPDFKFGPTYDATIDLLIDDPRVSELTVAQFYWMKLWCERFYASGKLDQLSEDTIRVAAILDKKVPA